MYEKIVVKGERQDLLFEYLTTEKRQVTWNFNKFLIGKNGKVLQHFESKVEPSSAELKSAIEQALSAK